MNYRTVYKQLMARGKHREKLIGAERHHIKPKCLGGSDHKVNLVYLSPEEHYVAHQLLVKLHPDNSKIIWAALAMTGIGHGKGNGRKGNKLYGWLRKRFIKRQRGRKYSEETKRKIGAKSRERNQGVNHPSWGMKRSKETCEELSIAAKAGWRKSTRKPMPKWSDARKAAFGAHIKAMFASGLRVPHSIKPSKETKKKMRLAKLRMYAAMKEAGTFEAHLAYIKQRGALGGKARWAKYRESMQ